MHLVGTVLGNLSTTVFLHPRAHLLALLTPRKLQPKYCQLRLPQQMSHLREKSKCINMPLSFCSYHAFYIQVASVVSYIFPATTSHLKHTMLTVRLIEIYLCVLIKCLLA